MQEKARILIVDDEEAIRRSLEKILLYEGYDVSMASNGKHALGFVENREPDVMLLDIKMPGMDGMEVLTKLKAKGLELPVIMVSGHGTIQTAVEATRLGAFDFLEKPLQRDRVLLACRNALEKKQLSQENKRLLLEKEQPYQMIGEHPQFLAMKERLNKVAPTKATVLITGESGTGKELIARYTHKASKRTGRFIQVNCAAIPEDLIESELFGHVKGSFTGATKDQVGKFQQADRGTIFLDEIADMSLKTQAKVLRVLQEGEVEPVGGNQTYQVDTRVLAATNKNLEDMVRQGTFREDLFFRLNVVPVHSIPLRERRSDIPLLIEHFRQVFIRENGATVPSFRESSMKRLMNMPFKGNVRELKNTVERLLILGESEIEAISPASGDLFAGGESYFLSFTSLKQFKEETEKAFLKAKIKENSGNLSKTAEAIGTPRSNLYKKIEQYGLNQKKNEMGKK